VNQTLEPVSILADEWVSAAMRFDYTPQFVRSYMFRIAISGANALEI
jgi:hypothetical protein